ncbi:DUF535 domain-containing protein [Virgibacillus sp. MSP4-1]|nr:DUF535 domain-containing protein [Virgibacillus sp. MSP4-1]
MFCGFFTLCFRSKRKPMETIKAKKRSKYTRNNVVTPFLLIEK